MRCLNCHTGMMATDTRCPACGMASPLGQAAATSLEARAANDPEARRKFIFKNWAIAVVVFLGGLPVTAIGALMFFDARTNHPKARDVDAADLIRIDRPESMPDWISYNSDRCIDTGAQYVKLRSRQTTSKFLLLKVQDRWLLAKVDPRFNGWRVEGKLTGLDSVVLPKVREAYPHEASRVLPYMFDGEYDIAATQRQNSILGGAVAVFGMLMLGHGLGRFIAKPPAYLGDATQGLDSHTQLAPAFHPSFQPEEVGQLEHPPRPRHWIVRTIFTLVWAVVFFVVAALIASQLAILGAPDDQEIRKQLNEASGRRLGPWFLLASITLVPLLGYLGKLPGTRR